MAHDPLKVAHSYTGKDVGNVTRKQNSISYSGEESTALQGVGIFLIKKWVVKVMSKQAK